MNQLVNQASKDINLENFIGVLKSCCPGYSMVPASYIDLTKKRTSITYSLFKIITLFVQS